MKSTAELVAALNRGEQLSREDIYKVVLSLSIAELVINNPRATRDTVLVQYGEQCVDIFKLP